jgi:hypothetical protein
VAAQPADERHQLLEDLRLELHAISSVVADDTVALALDDRPAYPPYGLVRSMHADSRMLVADPEPVEKGSTKSFYELGKALVDTTVFHLHRQFQHYRGSDRAWMVERLEHLLALFRIEAGPMSKARMRDGLSFVYGGLHFGTGVCVQLAEVMTRLLAAFPDATAEERRSAMARSIRPAYRLAALNIDQVIFAYQGLQAPAAGGSSWMKAEAFGVQTSDGRPWRIDFDDYDLLDGRSVSITYETLGCPARTSPTGGASAIADLWAWTVELAAELGLLEPAPAEQGDPTEDH